jgi:diguanylate cyclase (GGDEF)-like protein
MESSLETDGLVTGRASSALSESDRLRHELRRAEDLIRTLLELVDHDPLTGALNRRGFGFALTRSLYECERRGEPCALIMFDIDDFKVVNDHLGHEVGDRLLVSIVRRLRHALRESDYIARLGGDEFAILMPRCASHAARRRLKELREIVADASNQVGAGALCSGASFGSRSLLGKRDLDDCLSRVDAAMYRDKRKRKNAKAAGQTLGTRSGNGKREF